MEKRAEAIYSQIVDLCEQYLGKDETSTNQLDKFGKALFGDLYSGTFPFDYLHRIKKYGIINLDSSDKPGSHWVGVIYDRDTPLFYDSFGRRAKDLKLPGRITDLDSEQNITEYNCGCRCMAFLITYHLFGKNIATLI